MSLSGLRWQQFGDLKNDAGSAAIGKWQITICHFVLSRPGRYCHGSQTPDDGTELISGVEDHHGYLETALLLNSNVNCVYEFNAHP